MSERTKEQTADVESRIAKLERANKAWRFVALAMLGASVLTLSFSRLDSRGSHTAAAAEPATRDKGEVVRHLRVNEIELVNSEGDTVGWFNKGGKPSMSLFHDEKTRNKSAFQLEVGESGGELTFIAPGATGNRVAMVSHDGFTLVNDEGCSCLTQRSFSLTRYGSVAGRKLKKLDSDMNRALEAGKFADWGKQHGKEYNEAQTGACSVSIGSSEIGGGMIVLRNAFGKPVVEAQANTRNEGAVYVNQVDGRIGKSLEAH